MYLFSLSVSLGRVITGTLKMRSEMSMSIIARQEREVESQYDIPDKRLVPWTPFPSVTDVSTLADNQQMDSARQRGKRKLLADFSNRVSCAPSKVLPTPVEAEEEPKSSVRKRANLRQSLLHVESERDRRKVMKDHLSKLQELIPVPYLKPDRKQQTSQMDIVEATINFVKDLEKRLITLQSAQRKLSYTKVIDSSQHSLMKFTVSSDFICPSVLSESRGGSSILGYPIPKSVSQYSPSLMHLTWISELSPVLVVRNKSATSTGLRVECKSPAAMVDISTMGEDAVYINIFTQERTRSGQLTKVFTVLQKLRLRIEHATVSSENSTTIIKVNAMENRETKFSLQEIAVAVLQTFNSIHCREDLYKR